MYLDTPDGRVKAVIKTVNADGTFDWVSECGCYSGIGSKLKPKDEKGGKVAPVAEKTVAEKLSALTAQVTSLEKAQEVTKQDEIVSADSNAK